MKAKSLSGNREILTRKTARHDIDFIRKYFLSGPGTLYKINNAIEVINVISVIFTLPEVRYPCRFCIWANIICKNSIENRWRNTDPITKSLLYPIRMDVTVNGFF